MSPAGAAGPWMEPGREAALIQSAHAGDRRAYVELLREYQPSLYRVCFALVRDPDDASELAHDVAVRAWRTITQLPVGRPFFPWIARMARNLATSMPRRRSDLLAGRAPLRRPNGEPWGGALGTDEEMRDEKLLTAAFAALAPDDQLLLALRLVERLSYSEIASVFDSKTGAVMHRLAASREFLNAAMPGEERAA